MRGMLFVIGALLCAARASAAGIGDDPICADRPGKSSETCTVPAGHFQVETGFGDWSVQNDKGERDTELSVGETDFKYGLTDRSDIEVDLDPFVRDTSRSNGNHSAQSGFGDVQLLYKYRLTADGAKFEASLFPYVKIPTASHGIGNGKVEGGILIPLGYSIAGTPLSIGSTPELDWASDSDGHGHHAAMVQVVSLGWQVNDRLNLSAEVWGQWDWDPAGSVRQSSADAAIAFLVSNSIQLDAGANFGLNRHTPDVEYYAGVAKRF